MTPQTPLHHIIDSFQPGFEQRLYLLKQKIRSVVPERILMYGKLNELLTTSFMLVVALLTYPPLHSLYFKLGLLPEKAYFKPIISIQMIHQPLSASIPLLLLIVILFLGYRRLHWRDFEEGQILRYFILFLALMLAWAYSTYDYNLYFNQAHYLDRFLVVAFSLLIWISPTFVPLFLIQTILVVYQFEHPLGLFSWTDKRVVFDILILFSIFLYLKLFLRKQITMPFLYSALCLFAANYFVSGLGKLENRWVIEDRICDLVIASYTNGWFIFLPERLLLRIADLLKTLNPFLLVATLVVEVGALFMLLNKRVAYFVLIGFVFLHAVIFVTSGIFFWKWTLTALGFLLVMKKLGNDHLQFIFTKPLFLISLFVIYLSPHYFKPVKLAWYDTNLNTIYEMEAVGESGAIYKIPRSFMSPYDLPFAQNRFRYLSNEDSLVTTYSSTNSLQIASALRTIRTPEELRALEKIMGRNYYNESRAENFSRFIRTYFRNLNDRRTKTILINNLSPPHHIWNFTTGNVYAVQEKVQKVQVRFIKTFYDGEAIHLVENKIVRVIEITLEEPAAASKSTSLKGSK